MKKLIVIVLAIVGMLNMAGCADKEKNEEKMYIEPAQLTEEEEEIALLLGLNTEQRIYDFTLDESVQSIQVNTYRLMDGEWKLEAGGGGQAFSDTEGRIALGFERLDEGIRIAVQSEHTGGSTEYKSERNEELKEIGGFATSVLSESFATRFVAKSRRLKSTSDLSPSASPITIGVPLALGGVAGRNIARTPPITAAIAPPRNM